MLETQKNILVLTYGPVPTPEYGTIEGGGMRSWGLAKGLASKGHSVTVSINDGFPQTLSEQEGIKLTNWSIGSDFANFINSFDAVIMSYCMGDVSVFVAEKIHDGILLILDAYVPIYIEVSARSSDDSSTELTNYSADLKRFNFVLKRGDYFLCANDEQLDFYTGVLASLGIINPSTYHDNRILVVPFGIHQDETTKLTTTNPYLDIGVPKNSKVLLWFGGLYPWFNFKPLLKALESASMASSDFVFVIVGGKNPFNSHPDFVKQYNFVKQAVSTNKALKGIVYFVDWVDYSERINWYQHASMVISINSEGKENHFAWRTRIMDYLTSTLPILTNGGDPLSDYLIKKDAAIKIDITKLPTQLEGLLSKNNSQVLNVRKNVSVIASTFYWNDIIIPIHNIINNDERPYSAFKAIASSLNLDFINTGTLPLGQSHGNRLSVLKSYYAKAKKKGLGRSIKFASKVGVSYVKTRLKPSNITRKKQAYFLSHPIDETGAPLVLVDIVQDFTREYATKDINIIAPGIVSHIEAPLRRAGFRLHKMAMGISNKFIHMQLNIQYNDFVLMNTVALYDEYKKYVYWLLDNNMLKQATWFIHEDKPSLRFTDLAEIKKITKLVNADQLIIRVPSTQTAIEYNHFFHTTKIIPIDLRVTIPEEYAITREESDFEKINFIMSGTPEDGRKGQLLFLAALQYFEGHLKRQDIVYRSYVIDFISIGDDYVSQQINIIGKALSGSDFHVHKKMPKDEAMYITSKGNVTVCASLNETFALFVAEGMIMGHVVIRNHSSGWNEQVIDGENGYLFKDEDLVDFAKKIELVLNKTENSNTKLQLLGSKSQDVVKKYTQSNYLDQLTSK